MSAGSPTGEPRVQRGHRAHRLSVVANLGLAGLKLGVGWLAGSQVLLADGVHSLSDVALSAGAWIGYRWSQTPPDEDHHFGHGNGEALAGLFVGLVLLAAAGGLAYATLRWESTIQVDALGFAALGVVAVGLAGLPWIELAGAVAISLLIARMGWTSVREGFDVLMDRVPDPELRGRIAATAAAVEGVRGVQRVRVHPLGSSYQVDLEISVDGSLTVSEGHAIAHAVADSVRAEHERAGGVQVHVNPT